MTFYVTIRPVTPLYMISALDIIDESTKKGKEDSVRYSIDDYKPDVHKVPTKLLFCNMNE